MKFKNLFKKKRKKKLPKKKVDLNNGDFEWVFIDKKQKHIAMAQIKDKRIYVAQEFFHKKQTKEKQKTIIYHERGHSRFLLWRPLFYVAKIFRGLFIMFFIFSLFTFAYIILFYLLGLFYQRFFININYLFYGLTFLFLSLINLAVFTIICWMLEIIADFNAVKNMGIKNFKESIIKYYEKEKNFNLQNDWILHPPWKLRKQIMKELN